MQPYYQDDVVTIYHGDCRDVLPMLKPESVDLMWTDPPYGHNNNNGDLASARVGVAGARQRPVEAIVNDGADEMRAVMDATLTEAARILKRDCCCCCCCCGGGGPHPTFAWVAQRMDTGGFSFFHAVVWDKTARGPGMGWRYRRDYEMIMIAHRSGGRLLWANPDKAVSNLVRTIPPRDRMHPNQKPLPLVQRFVELHSLPGDTILDPFAGSGTTGRAAKDLGRKAVLIEIEERYCEIAARRMAQEVLPFAP